MNEPPRRTADSWQVLDYTWYSVWAGRTPNVHMPKTIIQAKDFNNRSDLDAAVISEFGQSVDKKDAEIKGTIVQLQQLGLSHNNTVWGVPVVATDYKPKNIKPVQRGKHVPSKLNGIKIKK